MSEDFYRKICKNNINSTNLLDNEIFSTEKSFHVFKILEEDDFDEI